MLSSQRKPSDLGKGHQEPKGQGHSVVWQREPLVTLTTAYKQESNTSSGKKRLRPISEFAC